MFADIHATEANAGQSAVPTNLDTDYHFTCFVQAPSEHSGSPALKGEGGRRLIELDGRRVGPIDRGPSENLLKVRFLPSGASFRSSMLISFRGQDVAAFVKERFLSESDSVNLNMTALAPPEN